MSRTWKDRPDRIRARKPLRKDKRVLYMSEFIYKDSESFESIDDLNHHRLLSCIYREKTETTLSNGTEVIYYDFYSIERTSLFSHAFRRPKKVVRDFYDVPMRSDMRMRISKAIKIANNTSDYEDTQISPNYINTRGCFGRGYLD